MPPKKPLKALLILVPLPILLLIVPLELTKRLKVFPGNPSFGIQTYVDEWVGGGSMILGCTVAENALHFRLLLKKGVQPSWAGVILAYENEGRRLDISAYQKLEVKMKSSCSKGIRITLQTQVMIAGTGIHSPAIIETPIGDTAAKGVYWLNDFVTPLWWYAHQQIGVGKIGEPNFRELCSVEFNYNDGPYDVIEELVIEEVAFVKDLTASYVLLFLLILAYYIVLYFIIVNLRYRRALQALKKGAAFPFPRPDSEIQFASDERRVIQFILGHFHDPELSLEYINRETGISDLKISKAIRQEFGLSFKQYLNGIRVLEAKRLIAETDRQIAEIAYAVGYNNISHFNRTFKRMEAVSPTEFKERAKSAHK